MLMSPAGAAPHACREISANVGIPRTSPASPLPIMDRDGPPTTEGTSMKINTSSRVLLAGGIAAAVLAGCATMSGPPTTFFITSTNPAQSGNLGGLSGADAICEKLAAAAGVGGRNWRAYLSTQGAGGAPAVNAR